VLAVLELRHPLFLNATIEKRENTEKEKFFVEQSR
jgi:hypothetical protein